MRTGPMSCWAAIYSVCPAVWQPALRSAGGAACFERARPNLVHAVQPLIDLLHLQVRKLRGRDGGGAEVLTGHIRLLGGGGILPCPGLGNDVLQFLLEVSRRLHGVVGDGSYPDGSNLATDLGPQKRGHGGGTNAPKETRTAGCSKSSAKRFSLTSTLRRHRTSPDYLPVNRRYHRLSLGTGMPLFV